jgi:DNA-binding response OmpR family regulator
MLVEDDPDVACSLGKALTIAGYEVVHLETIIEQHIHLDASIGASGSLQFSYLRKRTLFTLSAQMILLALKPTGTSGLLARAEMANGSS